MSRKSARLCSSNWSSNWRACSSSAANAPAGGPRMRQHTAFAPVTDLPNMVLTLLLLPQISARKSCRQLER